MDMPMIHYTMQPMPQPTANKVNDNHLDVISSDQLLEHIKSFPIPKHVHKRIINIKLDFMQQRLSIEASGALDS